MKQLSETLEEAGPLALSTGRKRESIGSNLTVSLFML